MTQIKICGVTNLADAAAAIESGADYLGFMFAPSPRQVTIRMAAAVIDTIPSGVKAVGVFVNAGPDVLRAAFDAGIHIAQLHGDETPEEAQSLGSNRCWKALRIRAQEDIDRIASYTSVVSGILLDAFVPGIPGGTGRSFDWRLAAHAGELCVPVILAGGLNPENVAKAIRQARPAVVDTSSGVEASPGRKDFSRMKDFVEAVRAADREVAGCRI